MPRKIRYQYPWKAIFLDQDGTLTGKGANTWATPYYKYHEQPECFFDSTTLDVYNGVLCDSTVLFKLEELPSMEKLQLPTWQEWP